jgi:hypothetical protein
LDIEQAQQVNVDAAAPFVLVVSLINGFKAERHGSTSGTTAFLKYWILFSFWSSLSSFRTRISPG